MILGLPQTLNFTVAGIIRVPAWPVSVFDVSLGRKLVVGKSYLGIGYSKNRSTGSITKFENGGRRGITHNSPRSVESKNPSPKWASYGGCIPSILEALDRIGDIDEALKPWQETLSNKERTIILKEQFDWERALEIFEWFKQKGCYELNVIHYNIMLRFFGKARRWDQVQSLWLEMQSKSVVPTNSTYGTLIDVFSKGGLAKEALVWLGDMFKQGLQPDEVTLVVVVQTYKKAGEFRKAEQFFRKWSSARSDGPLSLRCSSSYTFNTLIDTYGKAGQLKEAAETFAEMLKEGIPPNTVTFNTMIHICGNYGHLEEVSSLMAKMEELRCHPDTRTYNILISHNLKCDDIDKAAGYFSEMKKAGLVPDILTYRTLLYAFSIRQMVKEAEVLILEMEERGLEVDEFTQSALTRMYIDVGLLEQSWAWFERFQHMMSSECYAANIDAFGVHGLLDQAEKAFCTCLTRQKLSILVFNVMIKIYGIAWEYEKACEIFNSIENHDLSPDKCTYNSIIQILSVAELPHKAKIYLSKMQEAGLVNDCIPYHAVISSFAKLGELTMAEDLYEEMIGFGVQPDVIVFGVLINAFAEAGSVQDARNYVRSMETAGFTANSIICNSLIKLYTKVGLLQDAQLIYRHAQSLDEGPDLYSSNCMIELYCKNDMVNKAEEVFKGLKYRGEANEFSFAMMICSYKKVGLLSEAFGIAQEMLDTCLLTDALSYNTLIELFALNGRFKEVVKAFQQMVGSGIEPNDATFRSLGITLIKRGVSKEAINNLELVRKKDGRCGLQAWIESINTMLGFDEDLMKIRSKAESVSRKVDSFTGNRTWNKSKTVTEPLKYG